ncbi:MAG: gamma-glutamyl-gamma-aminobutyrate hydrolase family protein [Alphaproteobacteria bacterium]|nr:gamma-glutamyl-gamma-aminobutyrate hydrolase family protein [Alphaproteobacteria bacterium]
MRLKLERTVRPIIGITTGERPNPVMLAAMKWIIHRSGGRPVHITVRKNLEIVPFLSGLFLSGGADIDPSQYQQENVASRNTDNERDALETNLISHALRFNLPILGICRGAQMINVCLGGTLYQDAPMVFDGFIPQSSILGKVFARKKVCIERNSYLFHILEGSPSLWVNSLHHQAIDELGSGLNVVACDDHGLVQAIEGTMQGSYILGVQWHPELMLYSTLQRRIFKSFVNACTAAVRPEKEPSGGRPTFTADCDHPIKVQ